MTRVDISVFTAGALSTVTRSPHQQNPCSTRCAPAGDFQLAFSRAAAIMAHSKRRPAQNNGANVPFETSLSNTSDASTTTPAAPESFDANASNAGVGARSSGGLLKVLGVWFGVAVAVGNAIAAGIVRAPGDIAAWLPSAPLFIGVWMVGGLYALVSASSMAELGAAIPRSGGQYNFSRRALGDYPGFIVGWSDWLSSCGTSAAVSIVVGEYSGALFPALVGHVRVIAVGVMVVFFLLQYNGVRWGKGVQLATAAIKSVAFVVLVGACFVFGGSAANHAAATHSSIAGAAPLVLQSGWPLAIAFMLALQAVIYTIDGWDGIVYFGEEVRNPGRDVPRAIFGSVLSVMGIYLLINAAVLYILPIEQIAGNNFALGTVANLLFGRLGDPIIRSIMLISLISCINANQLFCSRTLFAMSSDRLFFRFGAKVNAGGTPTISLLLTTIVAIIFILGTFERVIAMLSFFFVANYALSYWSLFALRKKEPSLPRPYRAWGYPYTTALALVGSILFLVGSILTDRQNAPLALLLLIASYPIFRLIKWAGRKSEVTT
jgi:basic amino acid/polyamine antiporter, APA family